MSDREMSPHRGASADHRDRETDRDGDSRRRRDSRSPIRRKSRSRSRSRTSRDRRRGRSRSRSGSHSRRNGRSSREKRGGRDRSRSPMSSRKRHVGDREQPDPSRCLGVFGLSLYTTERELHDIFDKFGPIERVSVVLDAQSGRSRGFAFVYYENSDDARAAKEECSGMEIDGRKIRVDYSITQRAHTPTPGIYMGRPSGRRSRGERGGGGGGRYDRDRDRDRYDRRSRSPYSRRRDGGGYYDRYERSRSRSHSPPSRKYRRGYY